MVRKHMCTSECEDLYCMRAYNTQKEHQLGASSIFKTSHVNLNEDAQTYS